MTQPKKTQAALTALARKHRAIEFLGLLLMSAGGAFFSLYMPDMIAYQIHREFLSGLPRWSDGLWAVGVGILIAVYDVANGDEDARTAKFTQRLGMFFFYGLGAQSILERFFSGAAGIQQGF